MRMLGSGSSEAGVGITPARGRGRAPNRWAVEDLAASQDLARRRVVARGSHQGREARLAGILDGLDVRVRGAVHGLALLLADAMAARPPAVAKAPTRRVVPHSTVHIEAVATEWAEDIEAAPCHLAAGPRAGGAGRYRRQGCPHGILQPRRSRSGCFVHLVRGFSRASLRGRLVGDVLVTACMRRGESIRPNAQR